MFWGENKIREQPCFEYIYIFFYLFFCFWGGLSLERRKYKIEESFIFGELSFGEENFDFGERGENPTIGATECGRIM